MKGGGANHPPAHCGSLWVRVFLGLPPPTPELLQKGDRAAQRPRSLPAVWAVLAREAPGGHEAPNRPFLPTATERHHALVDVQGCGWWISGPAMARLLPTSPHLMLTACLSPLGSSMSTLGEHLGGLPAGPPPPTLIMRIQQPTDIGWHDENTHSSRDRKTAPPYCQLRWPRA